MNWKKKKDGYRRKASVMRCVVVISLFLRFFISPGVTAGGEIGGFHDLISLHERAVDHDAELSAARKKRDAGLEKQVQGRALLLPVIDLSAQRTVERHWAEESGLSAGMGREHSRMNQSVYQLRLSQPVIHLEHFYSYREARAVASISDWEYKLAKQAFTRRLVQAYLDVLRARVRKDTVLSMLEAAKAQARQVHSRRNAGLTSRIDVQEAEAEASRAKVSLIRANADLSAKLKELGTITGIIPGRILSLAKHFDPQDHELSPLMDFVKWGEHGNPYIRMQKAAQKQAEYRLKSVRGSLLPVVNLNVTAGRDETSFDSGNRPTASSDSQTDHMKFALHLSMPLFSGGATLSKHREARYQLGGAKEESRAAVIENRRNIRIGYQILIGLQKALKASLLSVAVQEETLAATQRSFEAGLRDTVDVLRAQRALFDARQVYEEARLDYILELADLYAQAGRLDLSFIEMVNKWLGGP